MDRAVKTFARRQSSPSQTSLAMPLQKWRWMSRTWKSLSGRPSPRVSLTLTLTSHRSRAHFMIQGSMRSMNKCSNPSHGSGQVQFSTLRPSSRVASNQMILIRGSSETATSWRHLVAWQSLRTGLKLCLWHRKWMQLVSIWYACLSMETNSQW